MSRSESPSTKQTSIITALFNPNAVGIVLPIGDHLGTLQAQEREIVTHASRKRQLEFSTGRYCAKTALAKLGVENFPVLRNKDRQPLWPASYVGSISHCRDLCGAVVAKNSDCRSIGFDIENIRHLKQNIQKLTCTEQELAWLRQQETYNHDLLVILLFSLKEAVFKCVSPHQNIQLGFKDVSITPNFISKRADTCFHHKKAAPDITLTFHITEQHVYSGAYY